MNNNEENEDKFYTTTGGWDWIRVPLLKPYYASKADPELKTSKWCIDFYNTLGTFNVKRVDVQDSIIYIISGQVDDDLDSTLVNLRGVLTGWYIINVEEKAEKGFSSEIEFIQYINDNNYPNPQWHDIDSLSDALGTREGKLPWMPD